MTLRELVVLSEQFEVSLRMSAGGAEFGSLRAYDDVSAVAAFPHLHLALGEHFCHLHIVEQCAITLLVTTLDGSYEAKLCGELVESLLIGSLGESLIHVRPFVVLALSSIQQVFCRVAQAVQLLEPQFGMLFLIVGGLEEEGCNLLEAFFLSLGSEVGVFVAGLRFSGESGFQIFLGLRAGILVVFHVVRLLLMVNVVFLTGANIAHLPRCSKTMAQKCLFFFKKRLFVVRSLRMTFLKSKRGMAKKTYFFKP